MRYPEHWSFSDEDMQKLNEAGISPIQFPAANRALELFAVAPVGILFGALESLTRSSPLSALGCISVSLVALKGSWNNAEIAIRAAVDEYNQRFPEESQDTAA